LRILRAFESLLFAGEYCGHGSMDIAMEAEKYIPFIEKRFV